MKRIRHRDKRFKRAERRRKWKLKQEQIEAYILYYWGDS